MAAPADFVIKTGDLIMVTIIPPTIVPLLVAPVPLIGSSKDFTVMGMPVCLEGDELPPLLRNTLPYISPPYAIPGAGTLSLTLTPMNKTAKTTNQKAVLIKGTPFQAEFTVMLPATMATPTGMVPDPVAKKQGIAQFMTTSVMVKAG